MLAWILYLPSRTASRQRWSVKVGHSMTGKRPTLQSLKVMMMPWQRCWLSILLWQVLWPPLVKNCQKVSKTLLIRWWICKTKIKRLVTSCKVPLLYVTCQKLNRLHNITVILAIIRTLTAPWCAMCLCCSKAVATFILRWLWPHLMPPPKVIAMTWCLGKRA